MPWYPSAKACPAAIKPTVQCFFPTLYQVLLFDFSSFGEKLFFCLRGYRRAIARSAVQKQPERRARMFLCSPAAEQAANGWRQQPCPTTNRLSPRNRAKRGAKTAGAQSAAPAGAFRSATAAGGTWRGDRMFLCSPAAEQAANGWRRQPGPTAGGSSKPRTTANKLSPRRAKLALNVRIGCSCRAHNQHKFSHRILQPHTKRRASHAD